MKFLSLLAACLLPFVHSFNPINAPGVSKPLNFFDPLGFSRDKTEIQFNKLQENEIKHGRVAMLSTLGLLTQKYYHPVVDGVLGSPIYHWQIVNQKYPYLTTAIVALIGLIELASIPNSWDMTSTSGIADLRKDYIPGNLAINLIDDDATFKEYRTKELNHGRLAMLATAIIILQELQATNGL